MPRDDLPLISPRSPSYARARQELRHPSPTGDPEIVALLARLSEAEENARRACRVLAERSLDEELALVIREDAESHQARREALGELIEDLGGSAPRPDECRQILVRAGDAVVRARGDAAARAALRVLRDELAGVYAQAAASALLDEVQRAAVAELGPTGPSGATAGGVAPAAP